MSNLVLKKFGDIGIMCRGVNLQSSFHNIIHANVVLPLQPSIIKSHKNLAMNFKDACVPSLVLHKRLMFWEGSHHPPHSFWNLSFWDDPGLNVMNFSRQSHLMWKSWMLVTKLGVCGVALGYHLHHEQMCHLKHKLFWHKQKKSQEQVWKST